MQIWLALTFQMRPHCDRKYFIDISFNNFKFLLLDLIKFESFWISALKKYLRKHLRIVRSRGSSLCTQQKIFLSYHEANWWIWWKLKKNIREFLNYLTGSTHNLPAQHLSIWSERCRSKCCPWWRKLRAESFCLIRFSSEKLDECQWTNKCRHGIGYKHNDPP